MTTHGAGPVRSSHRFDEAALSRWLSSALGIDGALEVHQFEGGQSNPTYLLTIGARRLVLRKKPPGVLLPSAHAIEREYEVLRALSGTDVPVPSVLGLCEDASIIGTPFYVMDHVQGRIFWSTRIPEQTPAYRAALYAGFVEALAKIHTVDVAKQGLTQFGKPDAYLSRQVQRWAKQFEASRTGPSPAMDAIVAWLPQHVPADEPATLIHGDFRIDNLIVESIGEPKILAVLDWELSTLGHPLADLAHACMPYHVALPGGREGLTGIDLPSLGIPTEAELVAQYCALTNRKPPEDWSYFIAFVLFRMGAILQGVYKRSLQGNASSAAAESYGAMVSGLAELACATVGLRP